MKTIKKLVLLLVVLVMVFTLSACAQQPAETPQPEENVPAATEVSAPAQPEATEAESK